MLWQTCTVVRDIGQTLELKLTVWNIIKRREETNASQLMTQQFSPAQAFVYFEFMHKNISSWYVHVYHMHASVFV